MRSAALSELVPQWSKFVVTDVSGRDPLGLARVAANITDYLMPGIVVTTDRARYYALYSWILWNIKQTEAPTTDASFADAFQRRESAFAIATLLQDSESSPVGTRAVKKQLERAESDVRTGFKVLPSNDLGGYGQYYGGSLYNLGITHRSEGEFDQVTEGRGSRLAEAVEKTIRFTPWALEHAYKQVRNSLKTLNAAAPRLTLDAIHKPFAEHERTALLDIFFGFDEDERGVASPRRQSLARLLDVIRAYRSSGISLGKTDVVTIDDQLLLGPTYFGTLVSAAGRAARPYTPPAFLFSCNCMWRQFCLHEILSWALESTLTALLLVLDESTGRGLPLHAVVEKLCGGDLVRTIEKHSAVRAQSPSTFLSNLGLKEVPNSESCAKARLRFSLKARLNEDALMRADADSAVDVLGRALTCLAVLYAKWRDGSDDFAWRQIRTMVGPELAVSTVLPRMDMWLAASETWTTCVKALFDLVMNHHDRVMYEKGRLEACWVHYENDLLILDQDYQPTYPPHSSRLRSAMGILFDLGLVNQKNDGSYWLTGEGNRTFLRVKELGQ